NTQTHNTVLQMLRVLENIHPLHLLDYQYPPSLQIHPLNISRNNFRIEPALLPCHTREEVSIAQIGISFSSTSLANSRPLSSTRSNLPCISGKTNPRP